MTNEYRILTNGTIFKVQWKLDGLDWTDLPGTYKTKRAAQAAIDRENLYDTAVRKQATWTVCK